MAARPTIPPLSAAVLLGLGRAPGDVAGRPLRVLVAEADPGRRELLRGVLEEAGDTPLRVAAWQQALGELSRQPVDAVLLATSLPGAGGLAAARTLRGWPAPVCNLPLLALHAGPLAPPEAAWREAGFDAMLRWPGALATLPAVLREMVVRLTPPAPLDPARRAALRAALGAEALAERDGAALAGAGRLLGRLREAADAGAAREAADALAASLEEIGAPAAAQAARAAAERFPPEVGPLMEALAAAGSAIRFEGRARR